MSARTCLLAYAVACAARTYVIGREFVGTSESSLISRRTQDLFACGTITTVFVVRTSSEHSTLACVARNRTAQHAVQDDCSHYLRCRRQSLASLPACYSSLGTTKRILELTRSRRSIGTSRPPPSVRCCYASCDRPTCRRQETQDSDTTSKQGVLASASCLFWITGGSKLLVVYSSQRADAIPSLCLRRTNSGLAWLPKLRKRRHAPD